MVAGLLNRILGFVLRIIMVRIIGDEGLGLFQMVAPLFFTFSIITTLGLPVAISKFMSEEIAHNRYRNGLKIFKISMVLVLVFSIVIVTLVASQAKFIAKNLLNDLRTYYIILAIVPALFFVSLSSVLRGFFQGLRIMTPTAVSQIIEQLSRMIITLLLLFKIMDASLKSQSLAPAIGISAGEMVGFLTLSVILLYYLPQIRRYKDKEKAESTGQIIKKLFKYGIPIACGRLVASLMYTIEAITIPGRLQEVGYSISQATAFYGQLSGMVIQLIYLPTIITIALSSNLVPAISESLAQHNYQAIRKRSQAAIRLTIYFGFLASIIFFLVPHQICDLLFNHPQAGDILRIITLPAIFMYLAQIFGGILQGLGKPNQVVKNSIIALIVELSLIYSVVYFQQSWALKLIVWAMALRYIIVAILNYHSISKIIKLKLPLRHIFLKPLLAGVLLTLILPQLYKLSEYIFANNFWSLSLSIIISTLFYFTFLILTDGITMNDLKKIK